MSTVATETHRNRRPGRIHVTTVRRMRRITPRMVRLTLGGDDLSGFSSNGSDQHVALYFYEPGVELPRPFTTDAARALLPTAKPRLRRYTIRDHRPELHEVDMDFVLRPRSARLRVGRDRPAGRRGDLVRPEPRLPGGPRHRLDPPPGRRDGPARDRCDPRRTPPGHRVLTAVEVADRAEEQPLPTRADATVTWLHRHDRDHGELLREHATTLQLPDGQGRVWGGAERGVMRELRHHFVHARGLDRADTHLTAYWTQGETQDSEV